MRIDSDDRRLNVDRALYISCYRSANAVGENRTEHSGNEIMPLKS